jgi:hypothetical protein
MVRPAAGHIRVPGDRNAHGARGGGTRRRGNSPPRRSRARVHRRDVERFHTLVGDRERAHDLPGLGRGHVARDSCMGGSLRRSERTPVRGCDDQDLPPDLGPLRSWAWRRRDRGQGGYLPARKEVVSCAVIAYHRPSRPTRRSASRPTRPWSGRPLNPAATAPVRCGHSGAGSRWRRGGGPWAVHRGDGDTA